MKASTTRCQRLIFLLGFTCATAHGLAPIWQRSFDSVSPPTFPPSFYWDHGDPPPPYSLRFAANGDLLLLSLTHNRSWSDVLRLPVSGANAWTSTVPAFGGFNTPKGLPAADGGAFVAGDEENWLIKIGANGSQEWIRSIPADEMALLPNAKVATGSCHVLSGLDAESGRVEWQLGLENARESCRANNLLAVDDDKLVLSVSYGSIYDSLRSRIIKVNAQGVKLWEHSIDGEEAKAIGADGQRIYLATESRLIALDVQAGIQLWRSAPISGKAVWVPGIPGILVVFSDSGVTGFSAATGAQLWAQPLVVKDAFAPVGQALMINTDSGLIKLDASTGDVIWTTALPSVDALGNPVGAWLGFGGLHEGQFLAVARVKSATSEPPPLIQRIDFLSGQLSTVVDVPSKTQPNVGNAILDGGFIYSLNRVQDGVATHYRLSKANAGDGTIVWSREELPIAAELAGPDSDSNFSLAVRGRMLVASMEDSDYQLSNFAVAAWGAQSGLPLWRTSLPPPGERWFWVQELEPQIDDDGDVWISLGTRVVCEWPDLCGRSAQYKLDGGDGSILWQRTSTVVTQMEPPYMGPIGQALFDNDLVTSDEGEIQRLDGSDGSVLWTAAVPEAGGTFLRAKDNNLLAVGIWEWAKLDPNSGDVIWSGPMPEDRCWPFRCYLRDMVFLPNGDLLQYGYWDDYIDGVHQSGPMVALLFPDAGSWQTWKPELNALIHHRIEDAGVDANGQIWMEVREMLPNASRGIVFLVRFDPITGEFSGHQALRTITFNWVSNGFFVWDWLAAPGQAKNPVVYRQRDVGDVNHYGTALIDTQVASEGNLSISTAMDEGAFMPGEPIPFEVTAEYVGTAQLDQIELHVDFPWRNAFTDITCTVGVGQLCTLEEDDGELRGRFSMNPGETVRIRGKSYMPNVGAEWRRAGITATVFGPVSLLEQNANDNVVFAPLSQSLFHNGFD